MAATRTCDGLAGRHALVYVRLEWLEIDLSASYLVDTKSRPCHTN